MIKRFFCLLSQLIGLTLTIASILVFRTKFYGEKAKIPDYISEKFVSVAGDFFVRYKPNIFIWGLGLAITGCLFIAFPLKRPVKVKDILQAPVLSKLLLSITVFISCLSLILMYQLEKYQILDSKWGLWSLAALFCSSLLITIPKDLGNKIVLNINISRKEIYLLLSLMILFTFYYSLGFNSWKYSFIGDEYGFLTYTEKILADYPQTVWLLEASGCFEFFPALVSWWQAIFLKLSDSSNYAWRLSMSLLIIACLPPLYLTAKHIYKNISQFPKTIAILICMFFFSSELIVIWARIGKPHAGFLPPIIFAPCLYLAATSRGSLLYYFLCGLSCGLGFYLSTIGPLIAGLIISWFFLIDTLIKIKNKKFQLKEFSTYTIITVCGFLVAASPILVQQDYFANMFLVNNSTEEALRNKPLFWYKCFASLLIPFYYSAGTHFTAGNIVDPFLLILFIAGIGASIKLSKRLMFFQIGSYIIISILSGAYSQYEIPRVTRIFLMIYPISIYAGLGINSIISFLNKTLSYIVVVTFGILSVSYSYFKLEYFNPYADYANMIIVELERIQNSAPSVKHILILPAPGSENIDNWQTIIRTYKLAEKVTVLEESPDSFNRLAQMLINQPSNIEVRMRNTVKDQDSIKKLVEGLGAHIGPEINNKKITRSENASFIGIPVMKLLRFVYFMENPSS